MVACHTRNLNNGKSYYTEIEKQEALGNGLGQSQAPLLGAPSEALAGMFKERTPRAASASKVPKGTGSNISNSADEIKRDPEALALDRRVHLGRVYYPRNLNYGKALAVVRYDAHEVCYPRNLNYGKAGRRDFRRPGRVCYPRNLNYGKAYMEVRRQLARFAILGI